jgi:hypothetical protein
MMVLSEQERRKTRSNDPLVALHYQLAYARKMGALDTIVVADASGVVVAGSGSWAACEELAAYAPLLAVGGEVPARIAEMKAELDLRAVDLDGDTVLVCARGKAGDAASAAVARAAEGALRILAA